MKFACSRVRRWIGGYSRDSEMMYELEVRHCRALAALSETGRIGQAADALGIAQSTMTEVLNALERVVGVRLLVRRPGRAPKLTAAALELLPHARKVIEAVDAAREAIERSGARAMRLGVTESVSSFLLPDAIARMGGGAATIDIELTVGICDDLQKAVREGALDAAIGLRSLSDPRPERGLVRRRLSVCPLVVVAAGNSSLADAPRLGSWPREILLPDPRGALKELVVTWLRDLGAAPHCISAGSIDGVKRQVLARGMLGVLPRYTLVSDFARGDLRALDVGANPPVMALDAFLPQDDSGVPDLAALLDALEASLTA